MNLVFYKSIPSILSIIVALPFIAGCGSETQGDKFDDGSTETGVESTETEDTNDDTSQTDDTSSTDTEQTTGPGASLTGKWAQLVNVSIIQTLGIPLVPADQWVVSRNFYLVDIESDGHGNLTSHEKICDIRLKIRSCGPELAGKNTSNVSRSTIDALDTVERHVTVSSDEPGTRWVSNVVYEVRGANLCNGECDPRVDTDCDPIPANGASSEDADISCDGPCTRDYCDQDSDGHEGITMTLTGLLNCDLYASQRWWARFNGEIVDENTIAGPVIDNFSEQHVANATTATCRAGTPGTSADNCPEHQYFKMIRLPDNATCEDVMALTSCQDAPASWDCEGDTSFPLNPKNDMEFDCATDCT